ncbi:MAG: transketolase family protein [Lachnospiraceae bacterium]|jgi:transketolase|nr:transketolase family protein [Lachnospiraceae bacterium]
MKTIFNGEKDTRLFKNVIGETIADILKNDSDAVYLDADLMNCVSTGKLPAETDRAIDCGIAEANMIGVAAGLAASGFKPIVHTFGPFASRRVFDQVFLSAGYAKNDIAVIGTDPGVTAAYNGGTHMPFEDVGLYRTLPGAVIVDITDSVMCEDILRQFKDMKGVKYMRVGRKAAHKMYEPGTHFEIGKGNVLREGKDVTIIASGIMVGEAMLAAETLAKEGVEATVIDMFTIKPLDEKLVIEYAKKTGAVVTAENHNKFGGLTSAVAECLSMNCPTPLDYVAVEDEFGEVGPQDYLQKRFGLTADHIVEKVKAVVKRK